MKVCLTTLAAASAIAISSPVAAQDAPRFDVGAGYGRLYVEDIEDYDFGALQLRGTIHFNDYLGAEIETQLGVTEYTFNTPAGSIDLELERAFGAFARAGFPVLDTLTLFGRVGYVDATIEASAGGASDSVSDNGFALGAGGEFVYGQTGLRADFTHYEFDDDDVSANGFALSVFYRFGG